jgi:hypothetical protein
MKKNNVGKNDLQGSEIQNLQPQQRHKQHKSDGKIEENGIPKKWSKQQN